MPKTALIDKNAPLKRAFLRGFIRMAMEDADAVKPILIACDFVEVNDDGSIDLDGEGWFRTCLLPKHTVLALGLFVRLQRWEQLRFRAPREAGLPTSAELLKFIGEHLCDEEPPVEYARWTAARTVVYRDHGAWLAATDLIVQADEKFGSENFLNAIADFLMSATINSRQKRR